MTTDLAAVRAELDPERSGVDQALTWLRDTFQITDENSLAEAGKMLIQAKSRWGELEGRRTALTKPLLAVKRGIDDLFSPVLRSLSDTEAILKAKIGGYTAAIEAQRRTLMQQSAAEFQAGGTPVAIIPEPARTAGVSVRFVWDFEVTEPDAVPRDLCSPDAAKIKNSIWYADTGNPPRPVQGIRFFQREQVSARVKP